MEIFKPHIYLPNYLPTNVTLVTVVTMVKVVTALTVVTVVTEVTVVSSKKITKRFLKKNASSQKNIASIANSCHEHISWLSMCQFVVTEKCHIHLVTKKF